jgi:hypothetical protein
MAKSEKGVGRRREKDLRRDPDQERGGEAGAETDITAGIGIGRPPSRKTRRSLNDEDNAEESAVVDAKKKKQMITRIMVLERDMLMTTEETWRMKDQDPHLLLILNARAIGAVETGISTENETERAIESTNHPHTNTAPATVTATTDLEAEIEIMSIDIAIPIEAPRTLKIEPRKPTNLYPRPHSNQKTPQADHQRALTLLMASKSKVRAAVAKPHSTR